MSVFLNDPIETHTSLQPLYKILEESCHADETEFPNKDIEELYISIINILILIMGLGKYVRQGNTLENNKLR